MNKDFWEIITAVFTAIGALATAGAVIFALWELRFKTKEKISISMNDSWVESDNPNTTYIGINVINTGYLPTKVSLIGITSRRQKNKKTVLIPNPYTDNYNQKIEIHDSIFYLLVTRDSFVNDMTKSINKGDFKKNENIYVGIVTPMKSHFKRTPLKFGKFFK